MADAENLDNTGVFAEHLENPEHAQNCDGISGSTADIDEKTARSLVSDLVDADIVAPVSRNRALLHEPSDTAFDSTTQLAVFHRGRTSGRNTDGEGE